MKKFIALFAAICMVTSNLSADAGRDKCPCDDYSNALAQADPMGPGFYEGDYVPAPQTGVNTGRRVAVLGAGAVFIGAIAAAIILSDDSSGSSGHSH